VLTSPRILLFLTDLEVGGTPTVVRELAWRLAEHAHVEVASLKNNGVVMEQLRERRINVTQFDAVRPLELPLVVASFRRFLDKRKFDVVLSFLAHANLVAAMAGGPRLLQSIQTSQPKPRWHWQVQSLAQRFAEKIVVPSPSVAQLAQEWSDVPADKLVVVPNALEPSEYREPAITRLPRRANEFRVGFVGRLDPVKRIPDLISAMTHLPERYELSIFGEGSERSRLVSQIQAERLGDRVHLRGRVTRPHTALAQIDAMVLPSIAEGFGLVLIEAMAAGVPIVATDVPGVHDVVKHEETGLLVPAEHPAELARAIQRVGEDSLLRERLTRNAYDRVRAEYGWDRVLPMYRHLLGC
jgi:glycosyltransferase involved in cell wall biosynthesis